VTITGTIRPVPSVALNGATVAAGPQPDGTWPAPMVLDGVSAKWGRGTLIEKQKPATGTVAIFDPSGSWAATTDLVGMPVTLSWTWATTTRTYFRGRVAGVDLARHRATDADGNRVFGSLVTLTCTSLLTDLANRPGPVRGTETVAARRAAVAAAVAGPVASVTIGAAYDAVQVTAADGKGTALAALDQLFTDTGGSAYTYDPHTATVAAVPRRTYTDPAPLAYLATDPTRTGAFIRSPGGWLDGAGISGAAAAHRTMDSRLTRVSVKYKDTGGADAETVTVLPGVDETVLGSRALEATTGLIGATAAATAAADLATLATEASGWAVDPLSWDTAATDGFETLDQALALISGTEPPGVLFLARSWLPDLGVRPVFGVLGGSIAYRKGAWRVQWSPAPIGVTGPTPAPLSWEALDPGLTWDAGPTGMHPSVTYEDFRFVTDGTVHRTGP
jgi:hypothetical protein